MSAGASVVTEEPSVDGSTSMSVNGADEKKSIGSSSVASVASRASSRQSLGRTTRRSTGGSGAGPVGSAVPGGVGVGPAGKKNVSASAAASAKAEAKPRTITSKSVQQARAAYATNSMTLNPSASSSMSTQRQAPIQSASVVSTPQDGTGFYRSSSSGLDTGYLRSRVAAVSTASSSASSSTTFSATSGRPLLPAEVMGHSLSRSAASGSQRISHSVGALEAAAVCEGIYAKYFC